MGKTEAQTRQELIDTKIRLAGWNLKDPTQVIEELPIDLVAAGTGFRAAEPTTRYEGYNFSDYALLHQGKPVAVIEAKRASKDAELGKEQGLQYAQNLQRIHGGALPFVFYTNGYDTFFWDSGRYAPEKVIGYPSRSDLEWMVERQEQRRPLSSELINTEIAGRHYQIEAIRSVLEEAEHHARRNFLLVMATGTGKTRTAAALFDVLLRSRWAKRVLFLVDRVALRDQALDAFKEHVPSEPRWPAKSDEKEAFARDKRVYVVTYPTMLNLIEGGTTPATWISPFFFDVVIADEAHRSIYNVYQQVLGYFSALKIGLTATPKKAVSHHTYRLFECQTELPTFGYTYEEAVQHDPPYLCDFEVLNVRTKFQVKGIKEETIDERDLEDLEDEGREVAEIDFEGTDIEKKVVNADTNAVIVREFMEESIKDPSGTLPGKSIIFAVSKDHARRLVEHFDSLYPEHKGKLARRIVHGDSRVHGKGGLLDQFKTEEFPRVAISVDMLDTGVDVREVVNLIFAKPVMSYVKFWQMIGRGTRVLEEQANKRKPWCPEKDRFLIIDCWGNFERFKMKPKGREPGQQTALPVRLFTSRITQLEVAQAARRSDITPLITKSLREDLAALPENNILVRENQKHLDSIGPDAYWTRLSQKDLWFLRNIIAPVMRSRSASNLKGLRFEKDVVDLSSAMLANRADQVAILKASLIEQISELPLTVNVVAEEEELINSIVLGDWMNAVTVEQLFELVPRLKPLMKYREPNTRPPIMLDLHDVVSAKDWIEFGPTNARMSLAAYREKVEARVLALVEENPVLKRLKDGEDVGEKDIRALADILEREDPFVTEELLRKVYDHKKARFIQFIRHILGLEQLPSWKAAVTKAFEDFIAKHNDFTALQLQFLQTLKTFVLERGTLEKKHLVSAPFTQVHPEGIRGVFKPDQISEIIELTSRLVA